MSGRLIIGDARTALRELEPGSVQCCVTSPPYWRQRDYGHPDQIGQEDTPAEYVASIVAVMREVRRALRPDGTLWLNLGDSYTGARGGAHGKNSAFASRAAARTGARVQNRTKKVEGLANKCLVGIPWRVAFGLMDDGWVLRMDHIWEKPNPTPSSVTDRCTTAHEYVFHFSVNGDYFFDPIREEATGKGHGQGGGVQVRPGRRPVSPDQAQPVQDRTARHPQRPLRLAHPDAGLRGRPLRRHASLAGRPLHPRGLALRGHRA